MSPAQHKAPTVPHPGALSARQTGWHLRAQAVSLTLRPRAWDRMWYQGVLGELEQEEQEKEGGDSRRQGEEEKQGEGGEGGRSMERKKREGKGEKEGGKRRVRGRGGGRKGLRMSQGKEGKNEKTKRRK